MNPARRLNVGCGVHPLHFWTNLDGDPSAIADLYTVVPPIPYPDSHLDEIYAGHFLEHLTRTEVEAFLAECRRCLVVGGKLGVVVPDTREVMRRYLANDRTATMEYPAGRFHHLTDLDAICDIFLYSTIQNSPHRWSYDLDTLSRTLQIAGFEIVGEIDRYRDPRITVGAWYQCGLDAVKVD